MGTHATYRTPVRIQIPDRRPQDPHPHPVGGGCQPHLGRTARRRRTRPRRRGVPAVPRTQMAGRRDGDPGLLAPYGRGFRRRRVLRPETAHRLGGRHRAARHPGTADQRHHHDRHLGRLLPLQRQFDLRPAPAVHPAAGRGRRGGRRVPHPAQRTERTPRNRLRTGQPAQTAAAPPGVRTPRRPHRGTPRLQGLHRRQRTLAHSLCRLLHAARRNGHARLYPLGRLRPL